MVYVLFVLCEHVYTYRVSVLRKYRVTWCLRVVCVLCVNVVLWTRVYVVHLYTFCLSFDVVCGSTCYVHRSGVMCYVYTWYVYYVRVIVCTCVLLCNVLRIDTYSIVYVFHCTWFVYPWCIASWTYMMCMYVL